MRCVHASVLLLPQNMLPHWGQMYKFYDYYLISTFHSYSLGNSLFILHRPLSESISKLISIFDISKAMKYVVFLNIEYNQYRWSLDLRWLCHCSYFYFHLNLQTLSCISHSQTGADMWLKDYKSMTLCETGHYEAAWAKPSIFGHIFPSVSSALAK